MALARSPEGFILRRVSTSTRTEQSHLTVFPGGRFHPRYKPVEVVEAPERISPLPLNPSAKVILFNALDRHIKDPYGPNDPTLNIPKPEDVKSELTKEQLEQLQKRNDLIKWYNAGEGAISLLYKDPDTAKWLIDRQQMAQGKPAPLYRGLTRTLREFSSYSLAKQKLGI